MFRSLDRACLLAWWNSASSLGSGSGRPSGYGGSPTSCRSSHLPLASWVLKLTLLRHWLPRSLERRSIWPRSANLQFLCVMNLVCVAVCFQGFLSLPTQSFSCVSMMLSQVVMVCGPLAFPCIGLSGCAAPDASCLGSGWKLLQSWAGTLCAVNSFCVSSRANSSLPPSNK